MSDLAIVEEFVALLCQQYEEFDADTLVKVWTDAHVENKTKTPDLSGQKLVELKALCTSRGLKTSGTKAQLISRLENKEVVQVRSKNPKKTKKTIPVILQGLIAKAEHLDIRRNLFDNYEHIETGLVFNEQTKTVVGKQDSKTGKVTALTERDIETCNEYKFEYDIPDTIGKIDN